MPAPSGFALLWLAIAHPAVLASRVVSTRLNSAQDPAKVYPVTRVVELLKDMKKNLEQQADTDEEVYEKLACWCTTNDKAKAKGISDAEARLSDLSATIEKTTALSATLTVEIKGLQEEVARNEKSLQVATALREKQRAEFIGEEKEMIQSIQALGSAVVVLSKHHGGGAALLSGQALAAAVKAAGRLQRHAALLQGRLTPSQKRAVEALAQQAAPGGDYYSATPTFKRAYKPQSGEIFGILTEMKETFENDLSESQREEVEAQQTYEQVSAAKENEIQMGQASLRDKQQQIADSDVKLAQSKQDREDTGASLAADKAFLTDLKLKCAMTDKDWDDRQKVRQSELTAVAEAIAILSADDARDLFSRTYNPAAFVQQRSKHQASNRDQAAAVLMAAAERSHSSQMAALAASVRLDPFTRVKKAIDDMVAQLLSEKDLEVKHKDWCLDELAKNERSSEKQAHTKATLESKIEGLKLSITGLNNTIEGLQSEISDLQLQLRRAKEDRDLEHKEFDATIADQRKSQQLLTQAVAVLKRIYAQASQSPSPPALVQRAQQAPPPGFTAYEKHGGATSVLALIEHIVQDTKNLEATTLQAETEAQDAFMKLLQETTNSVAAKQNAILDRTSEMTQAEQDLTQAKSELDGATTEIQALADNAAGLHGSCDFTLKNFDLRQAARDEEVAALRQAKAFLSGMKL
uniref:Uncharacterized protein n=1 Tax=Alexandrium catenella TaxID=2925 RepID=A0A7S1MSX9_ALECA